MLRTSSMSLMLLAFGLALGAMGQEQPSPFRYVRAKAFHIPPETTTEESGYFSLCEGADGKIYIGTAAYGRNAYDPQTKTVSVSPLFVGDRKFSEFIGADRVHPDWRIAADGKTAYLQLLKYSP